MENGPRNSFSVRSSLYTSRYLQVSGNGKLYLYCPFTYWAVQTRVHSFCGKIAQEMLFFIASYSSQVKGASACNTFIPEAIVTKLVIITGINVNTTQKNNSIILSGKQKPYLDVDFRKSTSDKMGKLKVIPGSVY